MTRLLVVLALAVMTASAGVETSLCSVLGCEQQCPDDDAEGKCPPLCVSCTCCPAPVRLFTASLLPSLDAPPPAVRCGPAPDAATPPAPAPRDILHVPRA